MRHLNFLWKMKNKKNRYVQNSLKEHIEKLNTPIFEKVPSETNPNHTMVVNSPKNNKKSVTPSLYNPHNYRLYFNFTKEKYKPKEGMVRGMVGVWFGKLKNYGKEFTVVGYGVRITVKKTQVEVINKLSEQQWFVINRTNAKKEQHRLLSKIDQKCITSLKKFIKVYGGKSDFAILKREGRPYLNLFNKCDNKIKNEPYIDKLPSKMTFETEIVKKVYKHPGEVEFKQPIYAAQHLENSALNDFAPEITEELKLFSMKMDKVAENMAYVAENYKSHVKMVEQGTKVNKESLKLFKRLNRKLDQKKLDKWFK